MPEPTSDPSAQQPPVQPVANPPADAAAIEKQILQKVFGDKNFASADEAARSYWELTNYASQAHAALQERVNPAPVRQDPYAELQKDALVNPAALQAAIRMEANRIVQEQLGPLTGALSARQQMALETPDYLQHEGDVLKWLGTNRQVSAEVQDLTQKGLHTMAAKWAFQSWRAANPPSSPGDLAAKQQAALTNGMSGGPRTVDPGTQPEDLRAAAITYGRMSGDKRAAYASVFPDFQVQLPPHVQQALNQR